MPKLVTFKKKQYWLHELPIGKLLAHVDKCDRNGHFENLAEAGYAIINDGYVMREGVELGFEKEIDKEERSTLFDKPIN